MDTFINLVVTVTLLEMSVAIGLRVTVSELLAVARNSGLVFRAAVANYVCVPAATAGLLYVFDAPPLVAAGFMILAACPGAPFGPPLAGLARGQVSAAVGLMVLLAGSSAIVSPFLLKGLLATVAGDSEIAIDSAKIVRTLLVTQLLPLSVGIGVRALKPDWAARIEGVASRISSVLNLLAVGLILFANFPLLAQIRPRGFFAMSLLLVAFWASGWWLGGPDAALRRTLLLVTSLRNISVGLVVATGAFARTPAVTAVVAFGVVSLLGTSLLAAVMRKMTAPPSHDGSSPARDEGGSESDRDRNAVC